MFGYIMVVSVFYAIIFVILIVFVIKTYNELVRLRNSVKNSFAQIDTQ